MSSISNGNVDLTIRDPESYPDKLKFVLDLITFNEIPKVVGSYAYTTHKYPSDVDVFERVTVDLPSEEAGLFYESQFKIIFSKLLINSNKIFITDFKAGEDKVLKEIIRRPDLSVNNLQIQQQLKNLLSPQRYNNLYSITNENIFRDKLFKVASLRWSPEEVLLGQKLSISGEVVKLSDALKQQAVVKLDVVTWIRNRFQSIEVLYNLNYKTVNAQIKTENIPTSSMNNAQRNNNEIRNITADGTNVSKFTSFYPLADYTKSLLSDINKFSTSEFYAPLKVSKRLWTLSRINGCRELLEVLNPLMESDVAALNQIKSELEIIIDIIDTRPAVFNNLRILNSQFDSARLNDAISLNEITNKLFTQVLNFSKRLANHLDLEVYETIKPSFTVLFSEWMIYNGTGKFNADIVKSRMNIINKILSDEIIRDSANYLESVSNLNIQCKTKSF